jgi:BirA family biotin operon repressor/biotin-[acetyl-CoA-carboxylase] ligase
VPSELKWPNDVLLNGRKTAGILVETASRSAGEQAALIGIGVNLNIESLPAELERQSTSVRIEGRREVDIEKFEGELRGRLFYRANELTHNGFLDILQEWKARDVSTRYTYCDKFQGVVVKGKYIGISESGAALIRVAPGDIHESVSATSVG